jgi:hypothetical protein
MPGDTPDLSALARDWITLWQSEVTALASDPEAAESVARLAALWAGVAGAMLRAAPAPAAAPHEQAPLEHAPPVSAGPAQPPGTAPAAAAPDAGLDALVRVLGRLDDRIGGIEQRLAALESGRLRPAGGKDRRGAGFKRRRP